MQALKFYILESSEFDFKFFEKKTKLTTLHNICCFLFLKQATKTENSFRIGKYNYGEFKLKREMKRIDKQKLSFYRLILFLILPKFIYSRIFCAPFSFYYLIL